MCGFYVVGRSLWILPTFIRVYQAPLHITSDTSFMTPFPSSCKNCFHKMWMDGDVPSNVLQFISAVLASILLFSSQWLRIMIFHSEQCSSTQFASFPLLYVFSLFTGLVPALPFVSTFYGISCLFSVPQHVCMMCHPFKFVFLYLTFWSIWFCSFHHFV